MKRVALHVGTTRIATLLAALLLMVVGTGRLEAQWLEIRPAVVLDGGATAGVRIISRASLSRDLIGAFPRSWHLASFADAPLLLASERNPETLRARVDGGILLSLFKPSTPVDGIPSPEDPEPWNYGFLSAQLAVGVEAPQDVNTADLTVGGSLEYGHDQYDRLWFLPEGRAGWDAVICADCDTGPAEERKTGSRWHAELGWSIPADRSWMPMMLRPLWLRLRGRAFVTNGLAEADLLRHEDGLWASAELAYRCDACGPVHEVYLRGHSGRLPVVLREERAVTAGVALAF